MATTRRAVLGAAALSAAAFAAPIPAAAAPRAELIDPHWTGVGDGAQPDPSAFDAVLAARLGLGSDGVTLFDYGGLDASDRANLAGYLEALAVARPSEMRRSEAFAYWANLYNALTLATVVDAYPVDSIRDIGGSFFSPGPWRDDRIEVEGRRLSLDDVEHGVLRPIWRDPRVHYAVNCASIGCPNLQFRAWRGETLDDDLDAAARDYVNHPRGARLVDRGLVVSSIYDWFIDDFGGSHEGVRAHLARYADPSLAAVLAAEPRIAGHDYDWALNDRL